jgi:hypothetical protein
MDTTYLPIEVYKIKKNDRIIMDGLICKVIEINIAKASKPKKLSMHHIFGIHHDDQKCEILCKGNEIIYKIK